MHFEAGMTFDRYVIQGLLGEGGMGEVYRAFDSKLRRRVALKILRRKEGGTGPSDGATSSILREARAAASLDHPNAVAIFDVGEHEGVPFLAMELIRGRSIRQIIDHEQAPMEQRVRWLIEIARALSKAHAAGIIHRDIKPENVMVSDDGVVKVLDFGLARRAPRSTSGPQQSASGGLDTLDSVLIERPMGTPPYMSPEQLRGEPLDGRTDQFSWGVLAYQLLTGAVPWSRTMTVADVIGAVLHEGAERPRARNGEIPEDVDRVILRALRKQREERFASMLDLLAALGDAPPRSGPSVERPASASAVTTEEIVEMLDSGSSVTGPSIQAARSPFRTTVTVAAEGSPRSEASSSPARERSEGPSAVPAPREPAASAPGGDKLDADQDVTSSPPVAKRESEPEAPIAGAPRQRSANVRGLARWVVLATALLVLVVVAWRLRPKPAPPSAVDAPPRSVESAAPAPAPTALLDLPPPAGCNAAATTAHQRGIQALHDGSWEQADVHFEQAASADPKCAAALLRFVMTGYYNYPISRTREVYQRAVDLRGSLSARDQALLDAMEPLVRRDPANLREYAERLRSASERFPGDSEMATLAAIYAVDVEVASRAARRAISVDPTYSDALQVMSRVLRLQGKNAEAMKTLEDCARIARNSVDCLRQRMTFLAADGRCAEVHETARTWIARDPKTTEGYWLLANALASEGASRTAVEEALRQAWDRVPAAERADKQALDTALVAALFGDFRAAEQLTRDLRSRADVGADVEPRGRPMWLLADVLQETRRAPEAAKIAESFLERRAAWSTNLASPGTDVVFLLLEPRLLDAARRGRRLDAAQIEAARASWARSLGGAGFSIFSGPVDDALLWAMGKAALVETQAEAEEALASMPPSLANLSEDRLRLAELGAHAGRAMLLAGRLDLSLVRLQDAASSCRALYDPILLTRSSLWLGQALEQRGDTDGACRAYNVVRRRWGAAQPPSITAEVAAKRATALRCPAP